MHSNMIRTTLRTFAGLQTATKMDTYATYFFGFLFFFLVPALFSAVVIGFGQ